jgi:hypothetical protein
MTLLEPRHGLTVTRRLPDLLADLMHMRFLMLRDIARLSASMTTLILSGTLCLSVRS